MFSAVALFLTVDARLFLPFLTLNPRTIAVPDTSAPTLRFSSLSSLPNARFRFATLATSPSRVVNTNSSLFSFISSEKVSELIAGFSLN